ncbi:SMP-30/gluconolactonase/LRE family protein [Ensifer sp. ENS05]|uniref:SMP-30/gluconolactonase/LRE family protein n=1 Tax=Ensifer sp. ENS05 TaxID=2769277 RepID=UPI0035C6C061
MDHQDRGEECVRRYLAKGPVLLIRAMRDLPLVRDWIPKTAILSGFERCLPDGSCVDAEGFIWNCRVAGGRCVVRFARSGRFPAYG